MGAKEDMLSQLEQGGNNVVQPNPEDEEIKIDEGAHRAELVCKEDILKVMDMDKPALKKYTDSRLGKKIDLSKRLKVLRTEVVLHIKNKLQLPTDTDTSMLTEKEGGAKTLPEFIFNPKNRRVFEWTELLAKRTDLIECWLVDEEGKRL
jgi:hypothetical protein